MLLFLPASPPLVPLASLPLTSFDLALFELKPCRRGLRKDLYDAWNPVERLSSNPTLDLSWC